MQKVFVVIVNYNGISDTRECVESVRKLLVNSYKLFVVVVDNGSKSQDIQELKKLKDLHLIESKENVGFTGGNNLGIKYALENNADFILLLNNDTTIDKNLIENFLDSAKKNENAGIFTPKIYFYPGFEFHKNKYSKKEKGRVIWSAGGSIDWENVYASNYGVDDTDIGQYDKEKETDFATGAAMFVRREVFDRVGLLNNKYFLYLEDLEFSCRAKKAGWKILFVPEALVWHKVSQSSAIGGSLNDYFISRNRLLFGMKYAPFRSKIAILRESLRLLNNGREWQRRGVYDFYSGKFGKGSWQ